MGVKPPGKGKYLVEDAVDAEPDFNFLLIRFDMDVAGFPPEGLGEDHIDDPDHRGFAGGIHEILDFFQFPELLVVYLIFFQVLNGLFGLVVGLAV